LPAVGGNVDVLAAFLGTSHLAQKARRGVSGVGIDGEDLLLGAFGPASGIGAFLGVIEFAAQGVERGFTVGGEAHAGDRLAVVRVVVGQRAGGSGELGTVSDPDVTHSPGVEDPCHAVGMLGGDKPG